MNLTTISFRSPGIWGLIPLFLCLVCPLWLQAVPASPEAAEVVQPDGKKIKIHLRGDEYFSWHEDTDGYVIQKDEKDKFWKYGTSKKDTVGFDVLPDGIVGETDPGALKLKKGDLPKKEKLSEHIKGTRESVLSTPVPLSVASASSSTDEGEPSTPDVPPPQGISVSGTRTVKNIVILACFSDHWTGGNNSTNTTYSRIPSEYTNLFNQINHTTDSAVGSVRDYYSEVSYGKLTVDSLVVPWVQLANTQSYYGADGASTDTNWKTMITNAIAAAEAAGFDFSQGDADGDGWVDCLTVIHSGYGQEYSGNSADCIWSKQGEISSTATYDGVKMKRVHTEPAMRGDDSPASRAIIRIGVICHEMGHFFGLPDLYDYAGTYSTRSVGNWCVMSGGSWNGSVADGRQPAHFSAWCKQSLGFVVPQLIHSQTSVAVPDVKASDTVYMIRDGCQNEEYFLFENRNKTGFDASLPGRGIMVWHIDPKNGNNDSSSWPHPLVKMEDADGDQTANETASAWYSGNAGMIAGGLRDQTTNIYTSAMAYQTGSYVTRTDSSASYTYNRLSSFSAVNTTMTVNVSTLIPTVSSQSVNTAAYTVTWTPSSEATVYEIQEGDAGSATSFAEGFEDNDDLHDQWVLAGCRRASANAKTGAYSMYFSRYDAMDWWNSVQSLRSRNTCIFTGSTTLQFYYLCYASSGTGRFQLLASSDNGTTWTTLWTQTGGYVTTWTAVNISSAEITSAGFSAGDDLLFSFMMNTEYTSGNNTYPAYGWAIDDFLVSSTTIPVYTNWTTLSDAVAAASYGVTGKTNGTYAYRVRGYSNSTWQRYSPAATVTVSGVATPSNSVAYDGNGSTSGAVPVDSNSPYLTGSTVTVLGNTNELVKTGYTFSEWNTVANGSGLPYAPGATFTITSNTTLFAQWIGKSVTLLSISTIAPYTYDGSPKTPLPAVTDGALLLTNSVNYLLSYTNNVNAGTATLTLTGLGYYYGTTNTSFAINPAMPTITNWPAATTLEIGQALSNAVLSGGSASVTGTFSYLSPTNIPPAGIYTAAVTFVASDSDNYLSMTGSVVITVIDIYAVPFQETFESRTLGDLDGQYGWVAEGTVVQTNKTFNSSTQAAQISEGSGYLKHLFTDGRTKVWFDARLQGVQSPEKPTPDTNATVAVYVSTNAMVMAFNGTNAVSTGITVQTNEWIRLTVFSDYSAKKYILYVNEQRVNKYDFYNAGATNFTEIKVSGEATFVDNVGITPNQPGMPGMPSLILLQ